MFIHHDLCFGCGRTNLFGLLSEFDRRDDGTLSGRWFVKQDHQGPDRGYAHPGIIAAGLLEAVLQLAGAGAGVQTCELTMSPGRGVPVGTFCEVEAREDTEQDGTRTLHATAFAEGRSIAAVRATVVPPPTLEP